jgi:hypothetical protein
LWLTQCAGTGPAGLPGPPPSPLEGRLLGALFHLAEGGGQRAVTHQSGVSAATFGRFFHSWCAWFKGFYGARWICSPRTVEELREVEKLYATMGFPGCVGSMDGVHVGVKVPYGRQVIKPPKWFRMYPSGCASLAVYHAELGALTRARGCAAGAAVL